MGFYYAKEKARFDREWDKLRRQYESAGMSAAVIRKLYEYDLRWFYSQRTYISHNQQLPEAVIQENAECENSRLFQKYATLSTAADADAWSGRYGWIDVIGDQRMVSILKNLSTRDLELLTLLAFEELTQSEIAQMWGCSQQSISLRLKKIKKIFQMTL